MRTSLRTASPGPSITRHFEASRHQGTNLATAFERALPIARRTVGRSPLPCIKMEHVHLARRASS
jgi:hypothetical protein